MDTITYLYPLISTHEFDGLQEDQASPGTYYASFIDKDGNPASNGTYDLEVIRSGNTNNLGQVLASVLHSDPSLAQYGSNFFDLEEISSGASSTVLNASLSTFTDSLHVPLATDDCNHGLSSYHRKNVDLQMGQVISTIMEDRLENYDHFTQYMKMLRDDQDLSKRGKDDVLTLFQPSSGYEYSFNPYLLSFMQAMNTGIGSGNSYYNTTKPQIDQVKVTFDYSTRTSSNEINVESDGQDIFYSGDDPQNCLTSPNTPCDELEVNEGFGQTSEFTYGDHITGMTFHFEAKSQINTVYSCDYFLDFADYQFTNWGLCYDPSPNGFFEFPDQASSNNITNGVYEFDAVATSHSKISEILNYSTTQADKYTDFMDNMFHVNVRGKNAIWDEIDAESYPGSSDAWPNSTNTEFANFSSFHDDITSEFEVSLIDRAFVYTTPPNKAYYDFNTVVLDYNRGATQEKFFIYNNSCDHCLKCAQLQSQSINPFLNNIRNEWTQLGKYVYYDADDDQYRSSLPDLGQPLLDAQVELNNTDVTTAGYYMNFNPGVEHLNGIWSYNEQNINDHWQYSEKITERTGDGLPVESENVLGIQSTALFGFDVAKLPVAISANASMKDISFVHFEDYPLGGNEYELLSFCPQVGGLNFRDILNQLEISVTDAKSHSGLRSLRVESGNEGLLCHDRPDRSHESRSGELLEVNNSSNLSLEDDLLTDYKLKNQDAIPVFSPYKISSSENKTYVLSYWVNLEETTSGDLDLDLYLKGNSTCDTRNVVDGTYSPTGDPPDNFTQTHPDLTIDGWTKREFTFDVQEDEGFFKIHIVNSTDGPVYLDDLRIYPRDATMKTFVYHPLNLRLLAELDENNFATFYQYDPQGQLTGIKRETEKGVLSTSENRQSVRPIFKD